METVSSSTDAGVSGALVRSRIGRHQSHGWSVSLVKAVERWFDYYMS